MNRAFRRYLGRAALFAATSLAGCASTAVHLVPIVYEGELPAKTSGSIRISLIESAARGGPDTTIVPDGAILIPIASGSAPKLHFYKPDQRAFVESLATQVERHSVATVLAGKDASQADVQAQIVFVRTHHVSLVSNEYLLLAVVEFSGGQDRVLRQYIASSSEKDGALAQVATFFVSPSVQSGKRKAATALMGKILPDLAEYVASGTLQAPQGQTGKGPDPQPKQPTN